MPLVVLFNFLDGFQVTLTGAISGIGKQHLCAPIIAVCYWCLGLPLGAVLSFAYDLELHGLWLGMLAAVSVHCVCYVVILLCYSWNSNDYSHQLTEAGPGSPFSNGQHPRPSSPRGHAPFSFTQPQPDNAGSGSGQLNTPGPGYSSGGFSAPNYVRASKGGLYNDLKAQEDEYGYIPQAQWDAHDQYR